MRLQRRRGKKFSSLPPSSSARIKLTLFLIAINNVKVSAERETTKKETHGDSVFLKKKKKSRTIPKTALHIYQSYKLSVGSQFAKSSLLRDW